jgi:phage repressor protein C with HTH and peptisase S24 domain
MSEPRPIDRFLEYLNQKGIKPASGEKMAGLSNGFINSAAKRGGEIGSEALRKISKAFLDIHLTYIITGEGQLFKNNDTKYDATPIPTGHFGDHESGFMAITPASKTGSKVTKTAPATAPPTKILIPQFVTVDHSGNENILYVPVRAAAGYPMGLGDREFIEKLPSFHLPGLSVGTYRAFEVDGDSMHPTLKNGEMVIGQWVEKLDYIRDDRVYIVVTKTGVVVKRLLNRIAKNGLIIAKSDATDNRNLYKTYSIHPEDVIEIWYAVWHGGFDFQSPADTWNRLNNNEADIAMLQDQVKQLTSVIKQAGILK